MCFGALSDGDARETSVLRLLRAEAGQAARQGAVTALAVFVILFAGGVGIPLATAAAAVGLVSTALIHQAVLLAAVAVLRWRADGPDTAPPRPA